jgi:uncharacterized protein YgbK (DUF1537 family)
MRLRLVADDLTGALDSAAEFASPASPVTVRWDGAVPEGSFALDAGTREMAASEARSRAAALAPALAGPGLAFRKIDSLLRGHVAAELAETLASGAFARCILAPAFPAQGRVTRGGVQWRREGAGWAEVGDLRALLGHIPGVTIRDAETDAELDRIVAEVRALPGATLWCGAGGLAGALAGRRAISDATLRGPVLGLFGSDQPVTARQVEACGEAAVTIRDGRAADAARVEQALARGAAMLRVLLPEGTSRADAARRIAEAFTALLHRLDAPATLVVAGGETLRGVCGVLGATALHATGLVMPGVPRSRLADGRWAGCDVISKSGAFGADLLWRDLLAHNRLIKDPIPA